MHATGDEPGDVRHVDEEISTDAVSDLTHPREVNDSRIRAGSSGDHLWLRLDGQLGERVVIDPLVGLADPIVDDFVKAAAEICLVAMGEMTAMRKIHREDAVARLQDGKIDGLIRLGAGVRLDIHVLRTGEKLFGSINRQLLDDVDIFTPSVPAPPWITLGIFVRKTGALRLHDSAAGEILAGNQLDVLKLPLLLRLDGGEDFRVSFPQRRRTASSAAGKLLNAALVAAAFELCGKKGVDKLGRIRRSHVARAEAEDIGIVVLAGDDGIRGIGDQRRANLRVSIGHDAHPDAAGTHEDAEIGLPGDDVLDHGFREIVVVDRVLRIRAEVRDGIAPAGEVLADRLLQFEPGVIAADRDTEPLGCRT